MSLPLKVIARTHNIIVVKSSKFCSVVPKRIAVIKASLYSFLLPPQWPVSEMAHSNVSFSEKRTMVNGHDFLLTVINPSIIFEK